jgi:hypothetical protein
MAFTIGNTSLRDREWAKFVGGAGTGSEVSMNVTISGGIHIGSVSANVDSIYVQSGANIVGSMYIPAGSVIVTNLGSIANNYVILCGVQSGTTTIVPLRCNAQGALYTISGTI